MTFHEAALRQYRRRTLYVVLLIGPNGEREELGRTIRKSGHGLLDVLSRDYVQERVKLLPNAETACFKKFADRLELDNGWRIEFGGTIRQEAQ